ncbi:hypothetical protein HPG69_008068 [Diceros bicornis minor]|uniref:Nascent polypeptide-associated complex subunit alpha-like UBA domain-containing protein n=1 Tax=Diceros bicornis minor TaxID=77932 RepID=A0A7J7F4K0_DICBM|nr:hypothetical protein HPG69_008068 [Diceros bicornis minor]
MLADQERLMKDPMRKFSTSCGISLPWESWSDSSNVRPLCRFVEFRVLGQQRHDITKGQRSRIVQPNAVLGGGKVFQRPRKKQRRAELSLLRGLVVVFEDRPVDLPLWPGCHGGQPYPVASSESECCGLDVRASISDILVVFSCLLEVGCWRSSLHVFNKGRKKRKEGELADFHLLAIKRDPEFQSGDGHVRDWKKTVLEQKAKKEQEKELAKVAIKKGDPELIMTETEISWAAEQSLKEYMGNVVEVLIALTS